MKIFQSFSIIIALGCFMILSGCNAKSASQDKNDRSISTAELERLMNNDKSYILLDVRTAEEVAEGMIPGAIHIDINQPGFDKKINALDKQSTIVTYCRSGGRADRACDQLDAAGFVKTKNYGGYNRWVKEHIE